MAGSLLARLGCLLAAIVIACPATAAAPTSPSRVVAIGDLHGDFAAWRAIAGAAGLVDARGRWTGGRTVLVQTGDVVDRGPDSLKILQDLMRLQREARRAGGQVVALVGNHEAMNVTGDLRYVAAGDYAAFASPRSARLRDQLYESNKAEIEAAYRRRDPAMSPEVIRQAWLAATPLGQIEHRQAWRPDGRIGRWVIGNPAVVLVNGSLFVHGGLCGGYVGRPLAEINRDVAEALKARASEPAAIINDSAGPLWCRELAGRDAASGGPAVPPVGEQLDRLLPAYGAQRIVIGHTPHPPGIAVLEGGRLALIDTGASAVIGGSLGYLEVTDGKLVPHPVQRPAQEQAK